MRRSLLWTFAGTVLLSAAAIWRTSSAPQVVAAVDRQANTAELASPGASQGGGPAGAAVPLPSHYEPIAIESAQRDIFALVAAPAPPSPPVARPVPPPLTVAPSLPSPPVAPPMSLRYLGGMVTPEGRQLVLLAKGETSVSVQPGTRLDDGYLVQSVSREAVRLVYPPTGTEVDIPIPPPPTTK